MIPSRRGPSPAVLLLLLAAAPAASCGSAPPRQRAEVAAVAPPASAAAATTRDPAEADADFMRGMIAHHAQALEMTGLVDGRAANAELGRLALRIEISQHDEIARMERWLARRGEAAPEGHAHGDLMPGMASPEEMTRLAAAEGAAFDRLFLELMIRHHEGALTMVRDLLAVEGAGREPELFQFLSHVDADQRAEIARMRAMLGTTPQGGHE